MATGGRYRKKKREEGLIITSLMDIMSCIVIFLFKLYSAEGQILTNAENMVLPLSLSQDNPREVRLQVAITTENIMVDNVPIQKTPFVRELQDISVPGVKEKLEYAMEQEKQMVKIGALAKVKGEIVIQADKNIDYDVLYKIMATCGEVGFNAIKFAVMAKEE
jgi:biopolymer transport protein ExbD